MMQWQVRPARRSGNSVAQGAAGVIGIVVIVALGLFALGAAAIIVVGLIIVLAVRRLLSGHSPKPAAPFQTSARLDTRAHGNVINGEFVVIDPDHVDERQVDEGHQDDSRAKEGHADTA